VLILDGLVETMDMVALRGIDDVNNDCPLFDRLQESGKLKAFCVNKGKEEARLSMRFQGI
jgi:hypothetical protein